jgi:tetratricopeptide (TPR) repeat protein
MPLALVTHDITKAYSRARQFELQGEYQRAVEQLSYFWDGVCTRPRIERLSIEDAAELLLRAGALTGWIGAARQIQGAQSNARDLVAEAARLFTDVEKVLECQNELASTYWREGDFETAAAVAREALKDSVYGTPQRLSLVNTLALVEIHQGHLKAAGDLLAAHADEAHCIRLPFARAVFHNQSGMVCKRRGEAAQDADERAELLDRALIEYEGACSFFEEVGHLRHQARAKNNIAMTLVVKGTPRLAHRYIQEAIAIAKTARDASLLGSFEDTRALAFLGEGKLREALVAACASIGYLRDGEELALQSESQTTRGTILARMGNKGEADEAFSNAVELAETAQISTIKIRLTRLRELMELHKTEALRYEREWVELALDSTGGHPSNAAKLLGISHQSCIKKIARFKLNKERTPVHGRRKKTSR